MLDLLLPETVGPGTALMLTVASAATSFLTAAAGIGGGVALLAVMAVLMPPLALIPVHGVVQLGSNAGRTLIMREHIRWRVLLPFAAGALAGAALGGALFVNLPPTVLQTALAAFILWSAWGPPPPAVGRVALMATGAVSTFLTMFFGATGPFVAATVKTLRLDRLEHVATFSACMILQHGVKVVAFGFLGFAFAAWLPLILAMVASGFIGTVIGKRLLTRLEDQRFHTVLSVVLTLLALRLLWSAASAAFGT